MKALTVVSPGELVLRETDVPTPQPDEVLIAPLLVGVCGTDLELIDGSIDPAYVNYPLILGHEWTGELTSDVEGIGRAGERVVVEGIIPCEVCESCLAGDSNRCQVYDEVGFTRAGALSELICVPAALIHRLQESVDPADAVFVEPMAVVWRALTRLPLSTGNRVAVIGDGTVALLAVHLLQLLNPAQVTVIGRRESQRALAARAGATEFVTATPAGQFDLVIEAAGTTDAAATAISLADRGGMVILLGLPAHGSTIEVAPDDLVNNDLIIQGSFAYTRAAFADVVQKVNSGALRPSFLITHSFPLEASLEAVSTLAGDVRPDEPRGKVTISLPRR